MAQIGFAPFAWIAFAAIIVLIMRGLAGNECKRIATYWTVAGIGVAAAKLFLIQLLPQWEDFPIDSLQYQRDAQALYLHWTGFPVDAAKYKLDGYITWWEYRLGPNWMPEVDLQYKSIFGTYHWIYAGFLALWQFSGENWRYWALLCNAAMAGAFPAATYILVRQFGATAAVGHLGALLMALEPSVAVNSSWFLKDTLTGFLCVIAVILTFRLCSRPGRQAVIALVVVLGLLSGVRFLVYIAFAIVLPGIIVVLIFKNRRRHAAILGIAWFFSLAAWGLVHSAPLPSMENMLSSITRPLQAQTSTLQATTPEQGGDSVVINWKTSIREQPLWAITRSIAHTLMAPYPWVVFTDGLTGKIYTELYLPGSLLWILSLPAMLIGMITTAKTRRRSWFLFALLALIGGAYIVFLGEWSTRQRIFMMPVFMAFAALGWRNLQLSLRGRSLRALFGGPQTVRTASPPPE